MKRFKKIMRVVSLILMIVLASVGLGMGAVFCFHLKEKETTISLQKQNW